MSDKLVEIPQNDWIQLRDLYKRDWPKNHVGYYTVDNFIRWMQKDPNIKHLNVYSLNGDWSDGTFVIIDRYQLFLNSLDKTNSRLKIALSLLDWSYGFKISSFLERHRPAVLSIVESKQLKKEFDSLTLLYYLPKSEALNINLNCPTDITLKPLSEEHAKTINDIWPNRHEGSFFFIKRLINWNPNIGAFTKTGELVAWCLRLQAGPLGALQVKETHKRRGLGSLVAKAMVKILADMDQDTFALVNETNQPSRGVFEKIGFRVVDNAYWLRTYPVIPFKWTD